MISIIRVIQLRFSPQDLWEEIKIIQKKKKKKGFKFTSLQLKKWKLKYHKLIMGKPSYDYFLDDKSFNNFKELMKKIK